MSLPGIYSVFMSKSIMIASKTVCALVGRLVVSEVERFEIGRVRATFPAGLC